MIKKKFLLAILAAFPIIALAQKNTNYLKVSAQAAIPTGNLADVVHVGNGIAVQGAFGFSKLPQYLTLEAGYNRFKVKNLPSGASGHYSALPIYAGYRARLDQFVFDAQAGVSFNHIDASSSNVNAHANQTAFGWAFGASYLIKGIELGLRYQSSEGSRDVSVIRFLGIRAGYNISL
ncbi:outer membrane beta-barrel protein [Pedobacter endophyticus]|uniref:Outer membrane beta-barrel protein n=1 Tax=Pedobacter endophyticus TaxID=2789740 RepID=A0A7S9L369_9SPHI|nr:outer membrane beta-barrel protein [Pedobacter endophyticus]QPH41654.1 outer membrane beta-barrel protein [Pedobacter endophyticus]